MRPAGLDRHDQKKSAVARDVVVRVRVDRQAKAPFELEWTYSTPQGNAYEAWQFVGWDGDDRLKLRAEVYDGKGTQAFSYDETTGDLTKVEDSAVGSFSAEYDAGGKMTAMAYPNGLEARYVYDSGGIATGLEYIDTTECSEGCIWFEDQAMPSIHGETLSQASTLASLDYSYDDAGRLVKAEETPQGEGCTTRLYAYDADTNRTAATTREPAEGGACAQSGGETQATARYQAALAPIVDVAEAQRLLLQAETEDNLARLTVWRAMLGEALAQGDLQPFLDLARKLTSGGQ